LPQASEHVLRLAEEHCRKLLEMGRPRAGLASRVRDRVEARMMQMPDMDEEANALSPEGTHAAPSASGKGHFVCAVARRGANGLGRGGCLPDRVFRWSRSRRVWAIPTRRASAMPLNAAAVALLAVFDRETPETVDRRRQKGLRQIFA
jgi:hypothetical protein